jgi:hypothetical protein
MISLLPAGCLAGWRVAFDGANGATCATTPFVLRALGADVVAIGCEPDGTNINSGVGSEHPEALAELVKNSGARFGIAHDGDGDRLVLCDEAGSVLDGDEILTLRASNLRNAATTYAISEKRGCGTTGRARCDWRSPAPRDDKDTNAARRSRSAVAAFARPTATIVAPVPSTRTPIEIGATDPRPRPTAAPAMVKRGTTLGASKRQPSRR